MSLYGLNYEIVFLTFVIAGSLPLSIMVYDNGP